jgi:hypothetical protein
METAIISACAVIAAALVAAVVAWRGHTNSHATAFIASLVARVDQLEARVGELAELVRQRDQHNRCLSDHIDKLEAHIWAGKPPPPPDRPNGVY